MNVKHIRIFSCFGAIAIAFQVRVHSQSFLTEGLVAYYPLDGNTDDGSGNGNNGNPQNVDYTTDRFGMQFSAALFSGQRGIDSAIDCPTLDNLAYLPVTYSCWFRLDGHTVADGEVMTVIGREQSDFPGQEGAVALVSSQGLGFTNELTYITNPKLFHFNSFIPNTNQWYHSVLTVDTNALISLFVDGSLYGTAQSSSSALAGATPLPFRIGASTLSTGNINVGAPRYCWLGAIDDVRVYERALSANEIAQLYFFEAKLPVLTLAVSQVVVSMHVNPGLTYQLEKSVDGLTWTAIGTTFVATNSTTSQVLGVTNGVGFFRVVQTP